MTWIHPYRFQSVTRMEELNVSLLLLNVGIGIQFYIESSPTRNLSFHRLRDLLSALVVIFQVLGFIGVLCAVVLIIPQSAREMWSLFSTKVGTAKSKLAASCSPVYQRVYSCCVRDADKRYDSTAYSNRHTHIPEGEEA